MNKETKYFDMNDVDAFLDKVNSSPTGKLDFNDKESAIANFLLVKEMDNQTYESGYIKAKQGFVFKFQTDHEGGTIASDEFIKGYNEGRKNIHAI